MPGPITIDERASHGRSDDRDRLDIDVVTAEFRTSSSLYGKLTMIVLR